MSLYLALAILAIKMNRRPARRASRSCATGTSRPSFSRKMLAASTRDREFAAPPPRLKTDLLFGSLLESCLSGDQGDVGKTMTHELPENLDQSNAVTTVSSRLAGAIDSVLNMSLLIVLLILLQERLDIPQSALRKATRRAHLLVVFGGLHTMARMERL